jgi:hypothetical protein
VSSVSIKDGAEVESGGRRFIIMQLIGFDFVVARDIETDDLVRLSAVDLNPVSPAPSPVPSLPDLSKVDDRDWAEARRRLDLIAPLLDGYFCPSPRKVPRRQKPLPAAVYRLPGESPRPLLTFRRSDRSRSASESSVRRFASGGHFEQNAVFVKSRRCEAGPELFEGMGRNSLLELSADGRVKSVFAILTVTRTSLDAHRHS